MHGATMKKAEYIAEAMLNTDKGIYFPQGIAGFSQARKFGLIYEGTGDIVCLQSVDYPEAAFLLTPWHEPRLGSEPELNREQLQCMQVQNRSDVMWMLVLNPFADKQWVTANLKAPIAVNTETRIALQCIRSEPELNLRYHWMPQPG